MTRLIRLFLVASLFLPAFSLTGFPNPASAGLASGDYERANDCRQLRLAGKLRWYSIASGSVSSGGGLNNYSGFVTKACHTTERSCRRWVDRIWFEISNLDTVGVAYCKRAN